MVRRRASSPPGGALLAALAVAAAAVTACSAPDSATPTAGAGEQLRLLDAPAPQPVHDWLGYDRPAEYQSVESRVAVPTRDGTALSCRRFQPGRDGAPDAEQQHPGLIMDFTPYEKESRAPQHRWFAERGYDVLVCDVRGSGDSPGDYVSWFQAQETLDNYDVIEWLAAQQGSNGRIAQIGSSYGSITAYRVAALQPPHLTTIVPMVSPTNIYAEWIYPGGVPSHTNMAWWASEGPTIDTAAHASTLATFQQHPLYDDFWKQIATTNKLSDVTVPVLHVGGYFDIFKNGGFDALAQRPDRTWLLTGPWIHNGFVSLPGGAPDTITTGTLLQWFDHWLEDRPGTTVPPTRVTSYESNSAAGTGRWTGFNQWPAESAQTRRLFPTADGSLSDLPPTPSDSHYSVNPNDGPSVAALGSFPTDPAQDQAESERAVRNDRGRYGTTDPRTTFTLPAFENDTTVAGAVTLHVNASLTTADTYFASKLEVVTPDGKVLPIEAGYLRAQLHNGLEQAFPVTPGEPTQYRIELGQTHWRFKTGEQLRITLSGGDLPLVSPTAPAGVVTIHHGDNTFVDIATLPA
jgi:uncharacterized protein